MEEADLVLLGPDGLEDEQIPGYLTTDLRWRPAAQCQFDRDRLRRLFAGLEVMRRHGERVVVRGSSYLILWVDEAALTLELSPTPIRSAPP